jgi:hypothetical protein
MESSKSLSGSAPRRCWGVGIFDVMKVADQAVAGVVVTLGTADRCYRNRNSTPTHARPIQLFGLPLKGREDHSEARRASAVPE